MLFVTVLISNILGLLRNVIIANRVGVTYGSIGPLDNYYAAFVLPDLLYSILIVGAIGSAILPLLVKLDTEQEDTHFWEVFNRLLSTGLVALSIGLGALLFLLPVIIPRLFPGFTDEQIVQTTHLSQIMLLSPLFFTISQIGTAALQARGKFAAPAIAPIVYNLSIITGALFIPEFGLPVLVVGVVVGAIMHFLVQLPALRHMGWKFQFMPKFVDPHVTHVLKLMIPRTLALTSTQLLLIAFYKLASTYEAGAISIYKLNSDLQTAPVLLFANTLAVAILPDFARHFAKQDVASYEEMVGKAIRLLFFMFLPLTLLMLQYSDYIINIYISIGNAISEAERSMASRTFSYF
ncbi:oligosaccharide flippase family protein, partial [Candidatus Berkelbacteria bacterium]|nr:oligosaccharide flippase family protein [Candidatus Berkelbacteria bacterium]